jgi:hypothetical protein
VTQPAPTIDLQIEVAEPGELSDQAIEALAALLLDVTERAGCLKDKKQDAPP